MELDDGIEMCRPPAGLNILIEIEYSNMRVNIFMCSLCGYQSPLQTNTRRHCEVVCPGGKLRKLRGEVSTVLTEMDTTVSGPASIFGNLPPFEHMDAYTKARLGDAVRRVMPCFIQHIDAYSYRVARVLSDQNSRQYLETISNTSASFEDLFVEVYRVTAGDVSPSDSARFVWKLDVGQGLAAGKLQYYQKVSPLITWKPVIKRFVTTMIEHLCVQVPGIRRVMGTAPLLLLVEQMDDAAVWGRVCEHMPVLSLDSSTESRC